MYDGVAPARNAAERHSPRNHDSRGSFTTSSSPSSANCPSSHPWSRSRSSSSVASRPASNHADGRASETCTPLRLSSSAWRSTAQRGSPNPLGLVSSACTSGCGTCTPRVCSVPDIVLVPLRPEPTTKTRRRLPEPEAGVEVSGLGLDMATAYGVAPGGPWHTVDPELPSVLTNRWSVVGSLSDGGRRSPRRTSRTSASGCAPGSRSRRGRARSAGCSPRPTRSCPSGATCSSRARRRPP